MPGDVGSIVQVVLVVLLSISVHEFAHAKIADMSGDDTPRLMGRVTLLPWRHWDPVGTVFIVLTAVSGFGLGWGRPVIVRPERMRNPRWDHFWSVAAGPLSNFMIAGLAAVALRAALSFAPQTLPAWLAGLLVLTVIVNCSLGLFNLLPIGPLDGHWLVGAFLPDRQRNGWYRFNQTTGSFLLLALILLGQGQFDLLERVLGPARRATVSFLLGG